MQRENSTEKSYDIEIGQFCCKMKKILCVFGFSFLIFGAPLSADDAGGDPAAST